MSVKEKIKEVDPEFFNNLDPNLKLFAREIRKELRNEGHVVLGITGYPGVGKSNDAAVIGAMIDDKYDFDSNVCYIPTSSQIKDQYLGLPMYSFLHIDEASRGLHKHKWHDKIQQTLNQLYETDREGHHLCTALLMPRFQNFAENFRNFMIRYWIHIPVKGLAIFYKRDDDKDCKDPWHIDENYKLKTKKWKNKRVFERTLGESVRVEQYTQCYWFYAKLPAIPKEVWQEYQDLKKSSRDEVEDVDLEVESYKDKMDRERLEKWSKITALRREGLTTDQIGAKVGLAGETVRRTLKRIEAYEEMNGKLRGVDGK